MGLSKIKTYKTERAQYRARRFTNAAGTIVLEQTTNHQGRWIYPSLRTQTIFVNATHLYHALLVLFESHKATFRAWRTEIGELAIDTFEARDKASGVDEVEVDVTL